MLAYANEMILMEQLGYDFEYIVPGSTILIQSPVAVVNTSWNPEKARALLDYLRAPEAQRIFGERGYRPVAEEDREEFDYPEPPGLFTVEDYDGSKSVEHRRWSHHRSFPGERLRATRPRRSGRRPGGPSRFTLWR